jgi:hypothetical protein
MTKYLKIDFFYYVVILLIRSNRKMSRSNRKMRFQETLFFRFGVPHGRFLIESAAIDAELPAHVLEAYILHITDEMAFMAYIQARSGFEIQYPFIPRRRSERILEKSTM